MKMFQKVLLILIGLILMIITPIGWKFIDIYYNLYSNSAAISAIILGIFGFILVTTVFIIE